MKPGKRADFIREYQEAGFLEIFKAHEGNCFYNFGGAACSEDIVYICDGWIDRRTFEAHDTSADVDRYRELYDKYVIACSSALYEAAEL